MLYMQLRCIQRFADFVLLSSNGPHLTLNRTTASATFDFMTMMEEIKMMMVMMVVVMIMVMLLVLVVAETDGKTILNKILHV